MNFKIINPASGIYGILNTWNSKLYIGSAVNLKGRLHTHKSNLNLNKHSNKHLQAAWKLYDFEFIVLEYVEDKSKLLEREQYWLNLTLCYDPDLGYNKRNIVNSNLGLSLGPASDNRKLKVSKAQKGRKQTEEQRLINSASHKGIKLSPATLLKMQPVYDSFRGVPRTEAVKIKIGIANAKADKWPHEKRSKCKCRDCADKRNEMRKIYNGNQNFVVLS